MGRALVSIYREKGLVPTWVDLPTPSDYTGSSTTVVNSSRNAKAQVIADVVASDIAKIELHWNFLTIQQFSSLAQLFEPKYNGSFFVPVSFFDVIKGDFDGDITQAPTNSAGANPIRIFYCGDRKVQFAHITLDNDGKPKGYSDVSLNLIDTGRYYGE